MPQVLTSSAFLSQSADTLTELLGVVLSPGWDLSVFSRLHTLAVDACRADVLADVRLPPSLRVLSLAAEVLGDMPHSWEFDAGTIASQAAGRQGAQALPPGRPAHGGSVHVGAAGWLASQRLASSSLLQRACRASASRRSSRWSALRSTAWRSCRPAARRCGSSTLCWSTASRSADQGLWSSHDGTRNLCH